MTAELRTVVEASDEHWVAPPKMPGSEVGVHSIIELLQDAKGRVLRARVLWGIHLLTVSFQSLS